MNIQLRRLDPNVPDPVESRRSATGRFVRFVYALGVLGVLGFFVFRFSAPLVFLSGPGIVSAPREIVSVQFSRQWPRYSELFDEPLVARYGFVELEPIREAFNRARHGFVAETSRLVSILTLEVWLRIIEERNRPSQRA